MGAAVAAPSNLSDAKIYMEQESVLLLKLICIAEKL